MVWILENIALILGTAAVLSAGMCGLGVRRLLRLGRAEGGKPILAMALTVILTLAAATVAFVTCRGVARTAPSSLAMWRMIDKPAPELTWHALGDTETTGLAELQGQVVLVNLWATWCPPCRKEMPDLERLQQDLGVVGFQIVHLSDEKEDRLLRYLDTNPMSTLHGRVEKFPWPSFGRPTTYLIDRDGIVRSTFTGARSYHQFAEKIRPLL